MDIGYGLNCPPSSRYYSMMVIPSILTSGYAEREKEEREEREDREKERI